MFDFLEQDMGLGSPYFNTTAAGGGPSGSLLMSPDLPMTADAMQLMGMNPNFGNFIKAPSLRGIKAEDQSGLQMFGISISLDECLEWNINKV